MYLDNDDIIYSPSDLTQFLSSPFASWMNHLSLIEPEIKLHKNTKDLMTELLAHKGILHEKKLLQTFKSKGLVIVDVSLSEHPEDTTLCAMRSGVDVIFQAHLSLVPFKGKADFLIKVPGESNLGDYHYEIWDTKLSKTMKPHFVIQVCAYSEMLSKWQGILPIQFSIVLGDNQRKNFLTDNYFYYYQQAKKSFLIFHELFNERKMPNPADSTSFGDWSEYAEKLLLDADDLSQTATITRSQIKKLKADGIKTFTELASTNIEKIKNLQMDIFSRLKSQARIQMESKGHFIPKYKILIPKIGEDIGLALLPKASEADVFFDIEGYPLIDGGLEYLWGSTYFKNGERKYIDFWAHDHEEEKRCFQSFIHWVYKRWVDNPKMHIYHYANYEIAACKKLMSRYGICEYEVDQLLRNNVFVDLYRIVKTGLLLGEPRYSIKNVEHLYRSKRETEVGSGGDSVVVYETWRDDPDGETWQASKILKDIRAYNIDDCNSTQELVDWLRIEQKKNNISYNGMLVDKIIEPKPEKVAIAKFRDNLLELSEKLNQDCKEVLKILAWSLEFHDREDKPMFWRKFERINAEESELYDDLDCLAYCKRSSAQPFKLNPESRSKKLVYLYQFDKNQKFKGTAKEYWFLNSEDKSKMLKANFVKEHSDLSKGIIALSAGVQPPMSSTIIPEEYINSEVIKRSILDQVKDISKDIPNKLLSKNALLDFLFRRTPNIFEHKEGEPIISDNEQKKLSAIISTVINLDNSYLAIQGPPGAGKTFTAKHIIAELLKLKKRIGICSNSHKAIHNLLIGVVEYTKSHGIDGHYIVTKEIEGSSKNAQIIVTTNDKIAKQVSPSCVIGTTAWGFSREDMIDQLDYLFIDEAGQVSLPNFIAISRSSCNVVLMGDQMQLGQPTQLTHPDNSGLSILDYLTQDKAIIPSDKGIFLDKTYRMHANVNQFISDAIYEGKLKADESNQSQIVLLNKNKDNLVPLEAGIAYCPVNHTGNTQSSDEEVRAIQAITNSLLGRIFIEKSGKQHKVTFDDILFITPYNHQVNKLKEVLGNKAKVGSVDKFQGQEAPIVILSMCASDAESSSRGMSFLLDKNRLNVAVSRSQAITIIVASDRLISSNATNIEQMTLINTYCHLISYAINIGENYV